jgi:tetratricopeptide (TPR) repeat protein
MGFCPARIFMNRCFSRTCLYFFTGVFFIASFGLVGKALSRSPRPVAGSEFLVTLPVVAQLLLAGGDRYLASNAATFRALVASTESMHAADFALQGKVQVDAAWLNPAHEDNYYIAAAILPWNGELDASQRVLRRASDARLFDWQPPFYYAFNAFYFKRDPVEGAQWLRMAAEHTDVEENILAFQQIAALWVAKGPDLEMAIKLHRELIKATKHDEFSRFLEKRVLRLENLLHIEQAIVRYRQDKKNPPARIEDLVRSGAIEQIPPDPFGMHYVLGKDGRPLASAALVNTPEGVR